MEELITISSEYITASFSELGAELKSLCDNETGIDYIWQGKSAIYPWSSMIMFPIVGKLKDNKFRLSNKYYRIEHNGFAKDVRFEAKNHRKDRVTFVLSHDKDSLTSFPYMFDLHVHYKVYGPRLMITFEIKNLGKKEMFYSMGYAPIFNLPIHEESLMDYYIEFSDLEDRGAYFLDNDLVNFHHVDDKRFMKDKNLFLSNDLFSRGEMIFKDINSSSIAMKNTVSEKGIELTFENAPYLSIWSQPGYPFIQITPSYGVADAVDSDHDFYKKEGLLSLDQEKSAKFEYSIFVR